jgi:hypothetical protein
MLTGMRCTAAAKVRYTASEHRAGATFEAAMDFGLTDEQVWNAAKEVATRTRESKPAGDCLAEVETSLRCG